MSLRSARRRPWPYHLRLGSILGSATDRMGFMLLPNEQGLLVGRKQQMLDQVVPSEQEYGSAPVYRERTWTGRPTGGYGERVQSAYGDRRYYWGLDVQVVGGLIGKGPLLHPVLASAPTGAVRQFLDVPNATGGITQLVLAGNKVYRRDDDTDVGQVVDKDFGAPGVLAGEHAVVFQGGYAGASPNTYVAYGTLWERTPAGVWTACVLPAGFDAFRVEVISTELWAADVARSIIRKCTADPKVAGSWSGPIFVGDPSVPIAQIKQNGNQLFIFKTDGSVFSLNSDGSTNDLFPGLVGPINVDNSRRVSAWLNALWFTTGGTFYRLGVDAQIQATGPAKMLDNASPVRGPVRSFCGWGGYRAYATLYNPETNTSYLVRYGNWEPHVSEAGTSWTMDDQWDGAEAHWDGKVASAMGVSGASGVERMYVGFSDGTWTWFKLVVNPLAADSGAEFSTGPSEIVFPLHHAMFQADLKHWLGFSVFGPVLRPGDEVTLSYRLMASAGAPPTDPSGSWLPLGEFTSNGQRIPAPANLAGNGLQLKAALSNTNQLTTPVVEIVAIHERVVPAFKRDLQMVVDARGFNSRLDGAVYRFQADKAHQVLMDAAAFPGSHAIELPDETVNEIALFGYQERLLPMQAGGGRGWAIEIQATQFRILTVYGIIRRLRGTRIRDLRGYTIGSLRLL